MYKIHPKATSYLTLLVNCTPVLITRGLSGCMGIHGCLSTTNALRRRRESLISAEKKTNIIITYGRRKNKVKGQGTNELLLFKPIWAVLQGIQAARMSTH